MALNHDIIETRIDRRSDATAGLAAAALLLALVLGFSAADIQARKALDAQLVAGEARPAHALLDGRGKWGGYLP